MGQAAPSAGLTILRRILAYARKGLRWEGRLDAVKTGDVLAVLESRELAEAKAAYLAGKQRLALAQANLAANEELKAKGVVPDLEFLAAKRDLAETEIELRAADFKLHTLGVTHKELAEIERQNDDEFAFHELRAPFAGTVIARHTTVGEVVTSETDVFQLADMSDVWANLTVYQKDLNTVRAGQPVSIVADDQLRQPGRGRSHANGDRAGRPAQRGQPLATWNVHHGTRRNRGGGRIE